VVTACRRRTVPLGEGLGERRPQAPQNGLVRALDAADDIGGDNRAFT
jgi:hypothetical protein